MSRRRPDASRLTRVPLTPAQRLCGYATAAVTGAAILILEILGAKILAPYFGTSHFVWTAQITVTLLALSAGCYIGGRWADRTRTLQPLYSALLAASVYLCVAANQVETVALGLFPLPLPIGSLFSSALLFFLPLALLAMSGPFLMRALGTSIEDLGRRLGWISAISTLGGALGYISCTSKVCQSCEVGRIHINQSLTTWPTLVFHISHGTESKWPTSKDPL